MVTIGFERLVCPCLVFPRYSHVWDKWNQIKSLLSSLYANAFCGKMGENEGCDTKQHSHAFCANSWLFKEAKTAMSSNGSHNGTYYLSLLSQAFYNKLCVCLCLQTGCLLCYLMLPYRNKMHQSYFRQDETGFCTCEDKEQYQQKAAQ